MASSTVSPAMNRRANPPGRMPYRDASRRMKSIPAMEWKKALETASIIGHGLSVRGTGRRQQVLQAAAIVSEYVAVAHAVASVLDHDNPACLERLGRRREHLIGCGDAEVGPDCAQRVEDGADAIG